MHTCITAQWVSGYALAMFKPDTIWTVLIAAAAAGITFQILKYFLKRRRYYIEVEATISRILERSDSDGDPTYAPEYTYYLL